MRTKPFSWLTDLRRDLRWESSDILLDIVDDALEWLPGVRIPRVFYRVERKEEKFGTKKKKISKLALDFWMVCRRYCKGYKLKTVYHVKRRHYLFTILQDWSSFITQKYRNIWENPEKKDTYHCGNKVTTVWPVRVAEICRYTPLKFKYRYIRYDRCVLGLLLLE